MKMKYAEIISRSNTKLMTRKLTTAKIKAIFIIFLISRSVNFLEELKGIVF